MQSWNMSREKIIGKTLFRVPSVSSTNDLVKTMASRDMPEGAVGKSVV